MSLVLTATANPGVASWTDAGDLAAGFTVHKVRVQLASFPAAATTGLVSFGSSIPANTVVVGALAFVNTQINLGASGITIVNLSVAVNNANLITTTDLVGVASSTWVNAFTDATSFTVPVIATTAAALPAYQITSDGPNLNGLAAFDATIFVLASATVLTVP